VTLATGAMLIRPHWRGASRPRVMVFVGGAFVAAEFLHQRRYSCSSSPSSPG